jgi:hypothetical protein
MYLIQLLPVLAQYAVNYYVEVFCNILIGFGISLYFCICMKCQEVHIVLA